MIKGVHTMFYSSEVEELRRYIKEKLGLPGTDVGGGWLIFDLPEADMGCHPATDTEGSALAPTMYHSTVTILKKRCLNWKGAALSFWTILRTLVMAWLFILKCQAVFQLSFISHLISERRI